MKERKHMDDPVWRKAFGDTLKRILVTYSIDYRDFCDKYNVSESTFRYWCSGKKLPQSQYMEDIERFLCLDKLDDLTTLTEMHNYVADIMRLQGAMKEFLILKQKYPDGKTFLGKTLEFFRNASKHKIFPYETSQEWSSGTIKLI